MGAYTTQYRYTPYTPEEEILMKESKGISKKSKQIKKKKPNVEEIAASNDDENLAKTRNQIASQEDVKEAGICAEIDKRI